MIKSRPRKTSVLKYSVLKPSPFVAALKSKLRSPENACGFEVAEEGGYAVRRYRVTLESLERFVQCCQWRFEQSSSAVRCFYLDLVSPHPATSRMTV